ncbi:probable disease resistance protein At4g19530 isoform X3 [Raphanus sativus]|nr:probable disease resistance protein At4g19530 isoform X3 [Raphanus sativus]
MRGIFLDMADVTKGIVLNRHTFINMLNLRYLKIYDSCCPRPCKDVYKLSFPDGLEFSLEKVRYLHWVKFPMKELPPDYRPENLVDLRLPYSKIERIWQGAKDTPWLKWVDLRHSKKLVNLSGLAKAESLQRLNLEGCTNLAELPGEMQNMKSLVYLNLRGCIRIWSLPEMNLTSLKTLILSNCSKLKEFRLISKGLEVLHLDGTAIKGLPPSIGNLSSLVLFNMKNCKKLEYLPNCLGQLKVLEELILSGCSRLKNIPAVRQNMKHVQILRLDETGAKKMPKISCFTGSKGRASVDMSELRHLCLSGNDFASLRNDIGKLYNLTWLDVKRCKKLRSIPMLPPRLEYFDAHGCDSLENVAHPLALLAATEQTHAVFNFSNCYKLTHEAKDNIISYSRRRSQLMLSAQSRYNEGFSSEALTRTCFPGGEVPEWFSHRGSGSVLEPQLSPQWWDSRFTGIALCAVILFPAYLEQRKRVLVNCNFEFKKDDGSSIHFSCTVGSWNEISNKQSEMESSHVFIGYTSRLDINKHGGYDEEGCFCTKSFFEFQVTDGTENVVGCQVLQCGFNLVYATDERENICWDAKTLVIPKRINYATRRLRLQLYGHGFGSKGSDLSENKRGEMSSRHHITPSEESNTKINNVLRLLIDQLNERQKDVLFDLACFFRSEDEYFIRTLFDSENPDSVSEVRDLAEKFLITICDGRVEMNDQVYMVSKELGSSGRLRLLKYTDILDKLREMKSLPENNNVRGIFLDLSEVMQSIAMESMTFINMRNLRYLKIDETCCPGKSETDCKLQFPDGFDFPLEEVRYFHWLKFPLEELPRDFKPENLVELRLPYSNVERLWIDVKDTPRLKWVDLSHSSKLLNLSGLAKAESLQRLNLEGCINLDELPRDMQNMKSLVYLNMRGCTRLRSLPQMNLTALKTLILSDCSNLKEFQVISESLEVLHLDGTIIKGLPLAIQKLERLVLLNLKNCKMLECLPNCLGKLKLLEELVLSGCSRLKNLPDIRYSMKHVQTLLFDGTEVNEMPNISCFIGSQDHAYIDMSFQHFGSYCSPSEWPQSVNRVSSLRRLCLSGHGFVNLHNDIGHLYNLRWLDVKQCKKLRSVPMLPPRLEYFNAHGCDSLERVANPLGIQILTEQIHATFNFSNCNKLDQDATDSIISYTQWKSQLILDARSRYDGGFTLEDSVGTCFPGWEVPAWFSHRASGYLLEPKLPPHWCDSRFTGIALCAVVLFPGHEHQGNRLSVKCNCEFKSKNGSRIRFSCTVGGWIEKGNTIESSHVFLGYASKLDVRKICQDNNNEEGCRHTDASFEFQVTDGTKKLEGYEVMKCGFSLVYASDELQVKSGEYGTNVETNQDITSSSWVEDFFGYIFLAFSCVIVFAILSLSVIVFAPQYYLSFSGFCWALLARILFFVAFGLFLKQGHVRKRK